jgi:GT2 family glycosyltransferase
MITYDVVIPHFGVTPDITAKAVRCIETIAEYSPLDDVRLIVIDNGSPAEDWHQITGAIRAADFPNVVVLRNPTNVGFVKAVEQGIAIGTAPYVVLMNNDTEAAPNWLQLLRQPFDKDRSIAICSPLTTDSGWQGRYARDNPEATGWVSLPPGKMVAFFCAMLSRTFLADVGFRHEAFEDFGGFGGDDYLCEVACKFGYRIALQRDLVIKHHRRTTFKALHSEEHIKELQDGALARFRKMRREL